MSQALRPDPLDDLAAVYRRLDSLDAGGRRAEQDVAARLIQALDAIGEARGCTEPRWANGSDADAKGMLAELRMNAACGDYGPIPSWVSWALGLGGFGLAYQ